MAAFEVSTEAEELDDQVLSGRETAERLASKGNAS